MTPLFKDAREDVRVESWDPGAAVTLDADGGAELFVLTGGFAERGEDFRLHSWLRLPDGDTATLTAGPKGATVWIKTGNLRYASAPDTG